MKKNERRLSLIIMAACLVMFFGSTSFADVPPPPVNQDIGIYDGAFGSMGQLDCEACHDPGVPDRHHMLYGDPIPPGSLVPIPDADGDGTPDTNYGCLNCHGVVGTDPIEFGVERDCTVCHTGDSPHHTTPDAMARHCTVCHGDLVDDFDDGHTIPTYDPSLVTPAPHAGECSDDQSACYDDSDCTSPATCDALPGGCNSCHDADISADPDIVNNETAHHATGLYDAGVCLWCHDFTPPADDDIRTCEDCHGFESLHNIAADTPNVNNPGTIVPGGEDAGYSHVGHNDDCWGCHGFSGASAPGTGPITPSISSSDVSTMTAGANTAVTLTGVAFTNVGYIADVSLTDADGTSVTLIPDIISQGAMTVTIPGSIDMGNYNVQAVKGAVASNPVVLSIIPAVDITDVSCSDGILTITGSGFGDAPPEGAEDYINVEVDGVPVEIISWTDTEIEAAVASCGGTVTVNALYGSDTDDGDSCQACNADVNQDGTVDLFDLIILISEFLRGDCATNPCQADCNGDGSVDFWDLIAMKIEFLQTNCCIE